MEEKFGEHLPSEQENRLRWRTSAIKKRRIEHVGEHLPSEQEKRARWRTSGNTTI